MLLRLTAAFLILQMALPQCCCLAKWLASFSHQPARHACCAKSGSLAVTTDLEKAPAKVPCDCGKKPPIVALLPEAPADLSPLSSESTSLLWRELPFLTKEKIGPRHAPGTTAGDRPSPANPGRFVSTWYGVRLI